jgi:hypothetical protein
MVMWRAVAVEIGDVKFENLAVEYEVKSENTNSE